MEKLIMLRLTAVLTCALCFASAPLALLHANSKPNITKSTFDFWNTFEFSYQSVGNPFSSPTKVLSNITNGALGYFGGYAAQFKTIIIPK